MSETEVLEWLRKNRFRTPELNIFMYCLIAIGKVFENFGEIYNITRND
jgi:hypothetical protein